MFKNRTFKCIKKITQVPQKLLKVSYFFYYFVTLYNFILVSAFTYTLYLVYLDSLILIVLIQLFKKKM